MSKKLLLIVGIGLLLLTAGAQVYKWVDEEGVVHYEDQAPPDIDAQEVQLPASPTAEQIRQAQQRLQSLLDRQGNRAERLASAAGTPSANQLLGYWRSIGIGPLNEGVRQPFFPYQWFAFYADGTTVTAMSSGPTGFGGREVDSQYLDRIREHEEVASFRFESGLLVIEAPTAREVWRVHLFTENIDEFEEGDLLVLSLDPSTGESVSYKHLRKI